MNTPSLAGLRFSVVGPGKVGSSLALWAVGAGARLESVAGREISGSAESLAARLGARAVALADIETAGQDFLLIATPDSALEPIAARLAERPQAAVAWHTAGARDASALGALASRSAVGSLHPLRAFPRPIETPDPETFYALDGDSRAVDLARRLVEAWCGSCAVVPPAARPLYHLGAWLSAGGVATLVTAASRLAEWLDLPPAVDAGYRRLAIGAIDALGGRPGGALRITGPVARGNAELVQSQLRELGRTSPELANLARLLGLETLRAIESERPLDARQSALREALASDSFLDPSSGRVLF